ncbi:ATP-dependent zinc protease family protein [Psychromonas aquimarina]|uniref:ATP-dependent zinc protease family protein n=1 Tax=Psychromonas aquimarina TaxID=444919 RepID=UPI00040913D5|nr:ATP-dependent zinc protease [Psychromonas aquimarina]
MFLNKTVLLTALALFVTSGCVSIDTESQQTQITNLQGELVESQKTNQKTQDELAAASKALKASQDKITELDALLVKAKKVKVQKPKTETVAVVDKEKIVQFDDKTVLGRIEWVYISAAKSSYKGRIDTGAATSSLNAVDIERFERDGKKWVRFSLNHDKGGDSQRIEAKIERIAKISQSSKPGVTDDRPVVKLQVRIGETVHLTEFTLTDRQHMEYPVLIGRTFMRDVILVDVSQEYIHPKYQKKAKK